MLTAGRYQRVWAPLGEHDLHVEDHAGVALRLNELSGGTREQLLLSLRLALVEEQRANGIHLPFILDDILVRIQGHRPLEPRTKQRDHARFGGRVILIELADPSLVRVHRVKHALDPSLSQLGPVVR